MADSGKAPTRSRRDTGAITTDLSSAVEAAERLEAEGKEREAAELLATAYEQAKTDYVKSHQALQPPSMAKPSAA